ncbi:MAG: hypothetical protein B7Z40_15525 [Bosea sp. 12-68-7]|nr:MAG: hypothetical protein B7Z40_15525 [Bosea sp. 12-68-7]
MPPVIKIVHVSDTHVVAAPHTLYGLDPRNRLARAVADIALRHDDAALCVVTGDLAHWGERNAYAAFASAWAGCPLPTILMIGNHDDREAFKAVISPAMVDAAGFVQGQRVLGDLTCLFLDTASSGSHAGAYCERRRAWLAQALAEAPGDVLIFMHHPPFAVGVPAVDAIALADAEAFASVVAPHRERIRHIFFGHLHRPISGSWRGIPFSCTRGLNHQLSLDGQLRIEGGEDVGDIVGSREPPGYNVALIAADRIVVHAVAFLDHGSRFSLTAEETAGRSYALGMSAE